VYKRQVVVSVIVLVLLNFINTRHMRSGGVMGLRDWTVNETTFNRFKSLYSGPLIIIIPVVTIGFDFISGLIRVFSSIWPRAYGTTSLGFELVRRAYRLASWVFGTEFIWFTGGIIPWRSRITCPRLIVDQRHVEFNGFHKWLFLCL